MKLTMMDLSRDHEDSSPGQATQFLEPITKTKLECNFLLIGSKKDFELIDENSKKWF